MPSSLNYPIYTDTRSYTGDPQVPREIMEMRISNMEVMQRMGTPVLLKRIYTINDVDQGLAMESPGWDKIYNQVRHDDPLSYGTGFCSVDTQPGEWYDPTTLEVFTGDVDGPQPDLTSPDSPFLPAPRYRGYGPGFLTYAILPDRPEDVFKVGEQGTMIQTQSAKLQLPWWPLMGDNDLLIAVELDGAGMISQTYERYQLKMVQPISMRGRDRSGRREISNVNLGGNRYWVGQESEAVRVLPINDPIYSVETDR
jgi:hypothetical protein